MDLLPWLEQANAYHELQNDAPGGVGGFNNSDNPNMAVLDGLFVENYRCPSSTVPKWASVDEFLPGQTEKFLGASYVGISGAAFRNGAVNPDTALVITNAVQFGTNSADLNKNAIHAINGILMQNDCVSIRDITDGTTMTMMIAEQSSSKFVQQTPGGPQVVDAPNLVLSSYPGSAWPGTGLKHTIKAGTFINENHTLSNVTTLRYPINMSRNTSVDGLGIGAGNKPIMSVHPGVAHVLFADGGVRGLSESVDFNILMSLADRKDNNVVSGESF